MHCGAEVPVVQGREALGSKRTGLALQMCRIGSALGCNPSLAPGEAAVVPRDLSCAWHPQPDVRGGPGHICWESLLMHGVKKFNCLNAAMTKLSLPVLSLKLSQLQRQRQSMLFSLC